MESFFEGIRTDIGWKSWAAKNANSAGFIRDDLLTHVVSVLTLMSSAVLPQIFIIIPIFWGPFIALRTAS